MSLLAGRVVRPDRLVALAGQGTDVRSLLDRQLSAQLPPELMNEVRTVLGRIRATGAADLPPAIAGVPSLAALFTGVNGAYLAQWMKTDPAAQAARLTVPMLVVHGDADAQVTLDEARRLHAARPDLPLRIVPGMSHVLKQATPDPASQAAAYSDPAVPLATGLADLLATFIKTGR
jgi:pimeloyl-ACP methyl ester carboxylesterase